MSTSDASTASALSVLSPSEQIKSAQPLCVALHRSSTPTGAFCTPLLAIDAKLAWSTTSTWTNFSRAFLTVTASTCICSVKRRDSTSSFTSANQHEPRTHRSSSSTRSSSPSATEAAHRSSRSRTLLSSPIRPTISGALLRQRRQIVAFQATPAPLLAEFRRSWTRL